METYKDGMSANFSYLIDDGKSRKEEANKRKFSIFGQFFEKDVEYIKPLN